MCHFNKKAKRPGAVSTSKSGLIIDDRDGEEESAWSESTLACREAFHRTQEEAKADQTTEASETQPCPGIATSMGYKHRIFRFLDLPPELRNAIYIDLLTIREKEPKEGSQAIQCYKGAWTEKFCFPEILQTCREIYGEAAGYLDTDGIELSISFSVCDAKCNYKRHRVTACHHGQPKLISCFVNYKTLAFEKNTMLFSSPAVAWPPILSKALRLFVEVDVCTPDEIHLDNAALALLHHKSILQ